MKEARQTGVLGAVQPPSRGFPAQHPEFSRREVFKEKKGPWYISILKKQTKTLNKMLV